MASANISKQILRLFFDFGVDISKVKKSHEDILGCFEGDGLDASGARY
jgi:hypothetical protein